MAILSNHLDQVRSRFSIFRNTALFIFIFSSAIVAAEEKNTNLDSAFAESEKANYLAAKTIYRNWLSTHDEKGPDDSLYLSVLTNLSTCEMKSGNFEETFFLNEKIISLAYTDSLPWFRYNANITLSELDRKRSKYETGLERLNELIFSKKDSLRFLPLVCKKYHRLAAIYNEIGLLEPAKKNSDIALSISLQLGLKGETAMSYNEQGKIFENGKQLDSAKAYYLKAINIWNPQNDPLNYLNAYYNYAQLFYMMGMRDSTIYHLKRNLELLGNKDQPRLLHPIYNLLSTCYAEKGDTRLSDYYKILFLTELRKAESSDHTNMLLELEAKYQNREAQEKIKQNEFHIAAQQKELEFGNQRNRILLSGVIILTILTLLLAYYFRRSIKSTYQLNNANKQLEEQNETLKRLLKDNEFLIQESHHRIKNNLQLVISLIQFELNKKTKSDVQPLGVLSSRIQAIASLHKHLYQRQDLESIDAKKFLYDVVENLKSLTQAEQITLDIVINTQELKTQFAVYLGLIITELITNSIKHAFLHEQEKYIHISVEHVENNLLLEYSDNGKKPENIGSEGKGMKFIDLMCRQLKGEFKYSRVIGFAFYLKFKVE